MRRRVLFLLLTVLCAGWSSYPGCDRHEPAGKFSIENLIPPDEYPDIHMYADVITDNCNSDAEKYAHQPEHKVQNTGNIEGIWEKAKRRYEIYEFEKTYTRLGWMLHLVQDMAVPAHAFNIPHYEIIRRKPDPLEKTKWRWPKPEMGSTSYWGYDVDDFEAYGAEEELEGDPNVEVPDFGNKPWEAYEGIRKETVEKKVKKNSPSAPSGMRIPRWLKQARRIAGLNPGKKVYIQFRTYMKGLPLRTCERLWANPHHWLEYWRKASSPYRRDEVKFEGSYGTGRPEAGLRKFPYKAELEEEVEVCIWLYDPTTRRLKRKTGWINEDVQWWAEEHHRFAEDRYNAAIRYGAAMLMAASKALPPLLAVKKIGVTYYQPSPYNSDPRIEVNLDELIVLENRKPNVTFTLEILEIPALRWTRKMTLKEDPEERLPWVAGPTGLVLVGRLADIGPLPENVTVKITVIDEDGNTDKETRKCLLQIQ